MEPRGPDNRGPDPQRPSPRPEPVRSTFESPRSLGEEVAAAARAKAPARNRTLLWSIGGVLAMVALAGAAIAIRPAPLSVDGISPQQAAERAEAFKTAVLEVQPVPPEQIADAQRQNPDLAQHQDLVRVFLWDDVVEDGDIVTVASGTAVRRVPLTKAGTWVVLPRPATGALIIKGQIDGGGGITLGLRGDSTPVFTPVIAPGQSLTVPVR